MYRLIATLVLLVPCCSQDVADLCSRCSCQLLTSSHLTDVGCSVDNPVIEVNCTARPKMKQDSNPLLTGTTASNATSVVWLSYRHASLTSLQPFAQNEFFFQALNVTLLALDHNKLVYIPPRAFVRLKNLTVFTASHNDINSVAQDAFKSLRHLRYVDLSFNTLHTLDFRLFADAANLISLKVQKNIMKSVVAPAKKLTSLEVLDVSVNKFPDFPLQFFSSFPNLRYLNVSHIGLETFPADLFYGLPNLKVLDASSNRVKVIDGKVVDGLRSLDRLYLRGNLLTHVDFVAAMPTLTGLDLSSNNLTSLGETLLSSKVQRLDVSHNDLDDLTHVFKVFDNLKFVDGGWNPVSVFPGSGAVRGLRELLLDGTRLESWPAQAGAARGSVDSLSLSHIPGVRALGPRAFAGILKPKNESGKCVTLKISNTSLSTIDEDAFKDIDICKLDLSHNQLRWVPASLLSWGSLLAVDLQGNPWHCDCSLQWMLDSVVSAAYKNDQALLEDLRCSSPPELASVRLVHWYNHRERALCGSGMLQAKARQGPAEAEDGPLGARILVSMSSSPLMLAVLLFLAVVATMLVILAFALQRRQVRMRKLRRNRRF